MIIREATISDREGVTEVLAASYPELMKTGYEPSVLEAALPGIITANPMLLTSGSYFVALSKADVVMGCGGWTRERPGTGELNAGLGHIRHFATHPAFAGKGIGRSIYLACERQARTAGIRRFECYSSLNAEGFYKSLGFQPVGKIDVALGNGQIFPSIHMMREI